MMSDMNKLARVSVCMATYNGEKYIKQQIDSILKQLNDFDELIISDDGSTDKTIQIIQEYKDERIRLFHHKHPVWNSKYYKSNVYVTANFENALEHARGKYIFLTDQDDIWKENKVNIMIDALDKFGGVIMSSITIITEDGSIKREKDKPIKYSFFKGLLVAKYLGSSMAISRSFLDKALPFPKNIVSHDAWIGLLATAKKSLTILDDTLLLYRRHSNNVTSKSIQTSLYSKLRYRFFLLINILKRTL